MKRENKKKANKALLTSLIAISAIIPIAVATGQQIIKNKDVSKYSSFVNKKSNDWSSIEDLNVATKDMFINAKNIEPITSISKGQALTPYGWLGTYNTETNTSPDDSNTTDKFNNNTLVLVGWDGSIIWANNDNKTKIYNAKYHFKSDSIFVIRGEDENGVGTSANKMSLTIHDAKTGKMLTNNSENSNESISWQFNDFFEKKKDYVWDEFNKKDLYYQDIITMSNGDVVWFYMPNMLKIKRSTNSKFGGGLVSFKEYLELLKDEYWKVLVIKKTEIENAKNKGLLIKLNDKNDFPITDVYNHANSKDGELVFNPIFIPGEDSKCYLFSSIKTIKDGLHNDLELRYSFKYDSNSNKFSYENNVNKNENISFSESLISFNTNHNKIKAWTSSEYNKAFLLPTRNMFDETVVTVVFPYAARNKINDSNGENDITVNVPIFNAIQFHFRNSNSSGYYHYYQRDSTNRKTVKFNFGELIYKEWITNSDNENKQYNKESFFYPWGYSKKNTKTDENVTIPHSNQVYNRVISVSPFDGTLVYAARPNQKLDLEFNDNIKNKFASFWIANSSTRKVANFIIPNDSSTFKNTLHISSKMIKNDNNHNYGDINEVYKNGFWFDINSISIRQNKNSLNLYYRVEGSSKNLQVNNSLTGVCSSPIGLLSDVLKNAKWIEFDQVPKITNNNDKNYNLIQITDKSYSNFITSRADLAKWYPKTYQNLIKGGNTYNDGELISNNTRSANRAIASSYNSKLNESLFKSNKSVELFSLWDSGDNFNNIPIKENKIIFKSFERDSNTLNAKMEFVLDNFNNIYINNSNKNNMELSIPLVIKNPSYQFLNSLSNSVKLSSWNQPSNSNSLDIDWQWISNNNKQNTDNKFGNDNIGYFENKDNGSFTFNKINDGKHNNSNPLRIELKINYDPLNIASKDWKSIVSSANSGEFEKTYPIDKNSNEKSFQNVLENYINWKSKNLFYGDVSNITSGIYGLGQLTIEAYLKLNPNWNKANGIVYEMSDGMQIIYNKNTKVKYLYKDEYFGSRIIYDQSSNSWDENNQYGFSSKSKYNSSLWSSSKTSSDNFKAYISDSSQLKNTLVRDTNKNTNDVLEAIYEDGEKSKIILSAKENYGKWAQQRFRSYNQMIGAYVIFEYQNLNSDDWIPINNEKIIKDSEMQNAFENNNYIIEFSNEDKSKIQNIKAIRFRLKPLDKNTNDSNNLITSYKNESNDFKDVKTFVSDAIPVNLTKINVDYSQFENISWDFTNGSEYLNTISKDSFISSLNKYEEELLNKGNLKVYKENLELKYSLNKNSDWTDADSLYEKLKNRWENYSDSNQGIIALYDKDNSNQNNSTKIYIKLTNKNNTKYSINERNNEKAFISKTKIKFKIDLSSYVNVLKSNKTNITKGNNLISKIIPPIMSGKIGSSFLSGKNFDDIASLLKKFGIDIEYQKTDNNWTKEVGDITTYDVHSPYIKIRFKNNNTHNVKATIDGNNFFTNNISEEISLQFNVPLLIKFDNSTLEWAKTNDLVLGNTKDIKIDELKEKEFIKKISDECKKSTPDALWDQLEQYLEIQYAIGDANISKNFHNRNDFIQHLKSLNTTQYNNKISIKLHLKSNNYSENDTKFILDSESEKNKTLYENNNDKIKIYIIDDGYSNSIEQTIVSGTKSKLVFTFSQKIDSIKSGSIKGLQLGFSFKQDIKYEDSDGDDIHSSWINTVPNSSNPDTQSLKIKIYVSNPNKYIYGGEKKVYSIDLTKVAQIVDVDSSWFNQNPLTIEEKKYLKDLKETDLISWENSILDKSNTIKSNPSLKSKISIKYSINDNNTQYSSKELINKLQSMQKEYTSNSLGIVQLWDGNHGTKIYATFDKSDQWITFGDTNGNTIDNLKGLVDTSKIKTLVDLHKYFEVLVSNKTSMQLKDGQIGTIQSFTPPAMINGTGFLNGKTFEEISTCLSTFGITFTFNETGKNEQWKLKENVNEYDPSKGFLSLGIKTEYENIDLKINFDEEIINKNNKQVPYLYKLNLLAPILISVDNSDLKQLKFEGNTKVIDNASDINTKILSIIEKIKNDMKQSNSSLDLEDLNVEIRFSLNSIKLENDFSANSNYTDDGIWYTFDKLNSILSNSKINYNSNKVLAKFYVKNMPKIDNTVDKYQLSVKNYQVINDENLTTSSNFKIYINSTNETSSQWIIQNLKITGSQENFCISNVDKWKNSIPNGLSVEYNVMTSSNLGTNKENQPSEDGWTQDFNNAKPINATRDFWIRFKVGEAYVFENASKSNSKYSDAIKLDASSIRASLKIKSEWLEKISLSGNLIELQIDEQNTFDEIKKLGQLPFDNIIQIKYTYDGEKWFSKDEFINELKEFNKHGNSINWIILRENIKACFSLNKMINDNFANKYVLEVDNDIIDQLNWNKYEKQLITDKFNTSIKGYINLDKLDIFDASNFKVIGTNEKAYLIIQNVNRLNELLNQYSSNELFSILYKWDENGNYQEENKIWNPGKNIEETILLNGKYNNRFLAIQFNVKNNNYDLYKYGKHIDNNSYEIKTPDIDVQISVAIENPLKGKIIDLLFTNEDKPIYYNGEGGFEVKISNRSFEDYLNTLEHELTKDEKEALELTYLVSSKKIDDEQYNEVISHNKIVEYSDSKNKYGIWKTLDTNIKNPNLNLNVNDYVILAIRIKKDKLTSPTNLNGYIIKDNDYIVSSQNRVFGYKVHTDYIDVDWSSLKLKNVGYGEDKPYGIDGYSMLDQISLRKMNHLDFNDDFLNVSLKLNYYNEFYLDKKNQILVSGTGSRLVKRNSDGAETRGNYKDLNGANILDNAGNPIPILYKDTKLGILANPIKFPSVKRSYDLTEISSNTYTLDLFNSDDNPLYSFFKNQDISIIFENKKGDAPNGLFDYYVDKIGVLKEYKINNQIKFPIQNDEMIQYSFNSNEFIGYIRDLDNIDKIYENTIDSKKSPINGQSKLVHMYSVIRRLNNELDEKRFSTIEEIEKQLKYDFNGQVILKTTYTPINGFPQLIANNEISSITNLQNGDSFKVEIISSNDNDLFFVEQPEPLIFSISSLYEQDIEESLLRYLRVQQNGEFNGVASFNIYVDNPNDDVDNNKSISDLLQGYKFMIRVWNKEKNIKYSWRSNIIEINDLQNGDKVEWRLVTSNEKDVAKNYYNTIANLDNHNFENNIYSFIQVNKIGNSKTSIISNSIGKNLKLDTYPEDSGFIIDGLKQKSEELFNSITEDQFIKLMEEMNFSYTGINGQGNMISDKDITKLIIKHNDYKDIQTVQYLIDKKYLTFYSNNIEFNWNQIKDKNGNWLVSPGTLSNKDKISIRYKDDNMASYYQWNAKDVSGLMDKSDQLSLLSYVFIGCASLFTLGIFGIIYLCMRNKKIKKK
ncbi:MAG: hypothetical protein HDR43_02665 [Mycoplasma sp.]|nr:hypothetical protein [Mycoplasma sp.]